MRGDDDRAGRKRVSTLVIEMIPHLKKYIYIIYDKHMDEKIISFFSTHFPSTKQSVIKTSRRSKMHSIEVAHSKDLVMNIRN